MKERTDIDIAVMKARLLEMKAELETLAHEHEHDSDVVELDQTTQGRLSRIDALQGQAMAQEVARRRDAEIKRIDAALQRMEEGEFGSCVSCGEDIQPKRLDFDPSVPNCISCAREGEE
jgi:DnaK suppressor protein